MGGQLYLHVGGLQEKKGATIKDMNLNFCTILFRPP